MAHCCVICLRILRSSSIGLYFLGPMLLPFFRLSSWDVTSQQQCMKETKKRDNTIGERGVIPWCDRRQRERDLSSFFRCT